MEFVIRTPADAREARRALAAFNQLEHHLDRARHMAECAEIECADALKGFGKSAAAEIDAAIGDMELSSRIARLEEALSVWEERGTSEPGRLLKCEVA